MYDGMGNQSDISIGKLGQGVSVSTILSAANLKVGQLNFPTSTTAAGRIMVATDSRNLALSTFDQALPNSGVDADNYSLGDIRNISVDEKGRITSIGKLTSEKDMCRLRVQSNLNSYDYTDEQLIKDVWNKYTFTIDSGWSTGPGNIGARPKGGLFFIKRTSSNPTLVPGTDAVNIRASLNPVWNTGDPVTYDPNGIRVFDTDTGRAVGVQFFSPLSSANPAGNEVVLYLRDEGDTDSYWNIGLQAIYY